MAAKARRLRRLAARWLAEHRRTAGARSASTWCRCCPSGAAPPASSTCAGRSDARSAGCAGELREGALRRAGRRDRPPGRGGGRPVHRAARRGALRPAGHRAATRRATGSAPRSSTPGSAGPTGGSRSTCCRRRCRKHGSGFDLAIAAALLGRRRRAAAGRARRRGHPRRAGARRRRPPGARRAADGRRRRPGRASPGWSCRSDNAREAAAGARRDASRPSTRCTGWSRSSATAEPLLDPPAGPTRAAARPAPTSPTSPARRWAGGRSRWPRPAGTTSRCSARPAPARPCWPSACRRSCPSSTTTPRSRSPRCTRSPARCRRAAALLRRPPFQAPHHTATVPSLVGGGSGWPGRARCRWPTAACSSSTRRPSSAGRALRGAAPAAGDRPGGASPASSGGTEYPARVQLVLAANPCPCATPGRRHRAASARPLARRRYLGRLSGPLLDRIDIQVTLHAAAAPPS